VIGEIIKEYLVSLGVKIDQPGFDRMKSTLNQTSGVVSSATNGWAKDFIKAGAIIGTALAGVSTAVAGVMASAAKQDLAMEKMASNMLVGKSAAMEMKMAMDALGESISDIQAIPELMGRYRALTADGRQMKVGGDYAAQMKDLRELMFEFTRLKQEASYALQWVGYYLKKHLSQPLAQAKKTFKSINDSIIKNMPVWTEKVARVLTHVINIGMSFVRLLRNIGKALWDVWDSFPRGVKIAIAALSGLFLFINASPLGRAVSLLGALLLLTEDYFGYMDGKNAALGPVWDKLNEFMDSAKGKMEELGNSFGPMADKFYNFFSDISESKTLDKVIGSLSRFGSAISDSLGTTFDNFKQAFENHEIVEKFGDNLDRVCRLFDWLGDAASSALDTMSMLLGEISKSEEARDLADAIMDVFSAIMELQGAIFDIVNAVFPGFFAGVKKTDIVYSFRDAIKAVVGIIASMIRIVATVIRKLSEMYRKMANNETLKAFWKGLGEVVGAFGDIVLRVLGSVGKLGRALLALVAGNYKIAVQLAGEALGFGKAEASGKYNFDGDGPTGVLAAEGESHSDPGEISSGKDDGGGKSYGLYQFASAWGVERTFAKWAAQNYPEIGKALLNSSDFDATWRELAQTRRDEFSKAQHEYASLSYYKPAADELLKRGFDISKRSRTLQEVLWSNAVQHSSFAPDAFTDLRKQGLDINSMSDEAIIEALYKNKIKDLAWSSKSPKLRPGLFKRWREEPARALEMLRQEREYNSAASASEQQPPQSEPEPPKEKSILEKIGETAIETGKAIFDSVNEVGKKVMDIITPAHAALETGFANVDPLLIKGITGRSNFEYAFNPGGNSQNSIFDVKVSVSDITVSQPNASPQEIGQAVSSGISNSLQDRANYLTISRVVWNKIT